MHVYNFVNVHIECASYYWLGKQLQVKELLQESETFLIIYWMHSYLTSLSFL